MAFERELVKQRILPDAAFPHHQIQLRCPRTVLNQHSQAPATPYFFNGIAPKQSLSSAVALDPCCPETVARAHDWGPSARAVPRADNQSRDMARPVRVRRSSVAVPVQGSPAPETAGVDRLPPCDRLTVRTRLSRS